jgi:ribosome-interacting GTPase 1
LLNAVTDTKSEAAAYEFTTLTCIPGNLVLNDTKIQLLDLPGCGLNARCMLSCMTVFFSVLGIIEGAAGGKGRGREVIAVARSADLILMVLDGARESNNQHRNILERELETMGIRLNKRPPDIYYRVSEMYFKFTRKQLIKFCFRKKRWVELNSTEQFP